MERTKPMPLEMGGEIQGHRILRKLGKGGFGSVYEALDLALERRVAFKVLDGFDAQAAARFRDEGRMLAQLDDPRIVRVYQVGRLATGQPYITMEVFGDGSLARALKRGSPCTPEFAVSVADQVLRGLAVAHARGVVHRDIKEPNILLDSQTGQVKICDFGIARARQPLPGEAASTGAVVLGTPHYVAPERFRGIRDDPRSDLYSVGVVFYRLLTGQRPFEMPGADPIAIAHRVATEAVIEPANVPRGLARICMRLLDRDPERRYQTALEAAEDLAHAFDVPPTGPLALPVTQMLALEAPEPPAPAPQRRGVLVTMWVASAAIAAAGAWWWVAGRSPEAQVPASAAVSAPTLSSGVRADAGQVAAALPGAGQGAAVQVDSGPVEVRPDPVDAGRAEPPPAPSRPVVKGRRRRKKAATERRPVAPSRDPRKASSDKIYDDPFATGAP